MKIEAEIEGHIYEIDLNSVTDLSIGLSRNGGGVQAFYIEAPHMQALQAGTFIGNVSQGGACNCEYIRFNAHGNGTHTESIGHITPEQHPLPSLPFLMRCQVITVKPDVLDNGDSIVTLSDTFKNTWMTEALAIRTLPNSDEKKHKQYSGQNPTYLSAELTAYLREAGVKHLLVDIPSVDREEDGGALSAHKAWWNYPQNPRFDATITELIYIPNHLADGLYALSIQTPSIQTDAVPSRPLLFLTGLIS